MNYEYNPVGSIGATGAVCAPTSAGYGTVAGITGVSQTNLSVMKQYVGTAPVASSPAACGDKAYPRVGPGNESQRTGINGKAWTGVPVEIGLVPVSSPAYTNTETGIVSIDYDISNRDSLRGPLHFEPYRHRRFRGFSVGLLSNCSGQYLPRSAFRVSYVFPGIG